MNEFPDVLSVVLTGYGGPDKIKVEKVPHPGEPVGTQVLVKVHTCGVNFADIYTRLGLVQDSPPPFVLGLECCGVVQALGPSVPLGSLKVGDRVLVHGSHLQSEVVLAEASSCFSVPDSMSDVEAAAFPVNYLTAHFCLFEIGNLREGQTVLIPSAGGGVGWAATQLAKTIPGIKIIGLASGDKHEEILRNGVDVAIDYSTSADWPDSVRNAAGPAGIDLALEFTSGSNFLITQRLVNDLGRVVLIGANCLIGEESLRQDGGETEIVPAVELISRSLSVSGFHLNLVKEKLPKKYRSVMTQLLDLFVRNEKIRPRIDSVWSFHQVALATERLSKRLNIGKVILKPNL